MTVALGEAKPSQLYLMPMVVAQASQTQAVLTTAVLSRLLQTTQAAAIVFTSGNRLPQAVPRNHQQCFWVTSPHSAQSLSQLKGDSYA